MGRIAQALNALRGTIPDKLVLPFRPLKVRCLSSFQWTQVGTGDCGGHDVGRSNGPKPDKAFCGPSTEGQVSVCWKDWCTYKLATPQSCVGGGSPGDMYQCIFDVQSGDPQQSTLVKNP